MHDNDDLLNTRGAAKTLDVSERTLIRWRNERIGPPNQSSVAGWNGDNAKDTTIRRCSTTTCRHCAAWARAHHHHELMSKALREALHG